MRETKDIIRQVKLNLIKKGFNEKEAFYKIVAFFKNNMGVNNDDKKMEEDLSLLSQVDRKFVEQEDSYSWIYQYCISGTEEQGKKGIYYTPAWVVRYIVDNTWNAFRKSNPSLRIEEIRIVDPACGTGNFIIAMVDCLWLEYKKEGLYTSEEIIDKIINQIWAYDIDEEAIKICLLNLERKFSLLSGKEVRIQGSHLYCEDFLLHFNKEKFHLVLGNPPYLENRKINKYYDKREFQKRFMVAKGRFDLFSLFIEKGLQIIEKGSMLAFVVPNSILYNNNFEDIRKLMLEKTKILKLIDLGEGIFDGVGLEMAIIMIEKGLGEDRQHKITIGNRINRKMKSYGFEQISFTMIPQSYYRYSLKSVFDIYSDEEVIGFRNRVMAYERKIEDCCEVIAGIATGNIRNKLVLEEKINPYCFKVLEGKNIERYSLKWGRKYVHYNKEIIDRGAGEYATFMRQEFIDGPKILIRQTADEVIATYDEDGYYLLNTLYSLVVRDLRLHIKYILALLNSKLISFLYQSLVREKGKIFPQLKIFHIKNMPVVIPSKEVQGKIVEIVDQLLRLHKEDHGAGNQLDYEKLMQVIDKEIYKLYQLTPAEIQRIDSFPRRDPQEKSGRL